MSMVDEAMSQLLELNQVLGKEGDLYEFPNVTGTLEIKFLSMIPTGNVVMATAWVESSGGRKTRVRCDLTDEHGEKLASVQSIWVALQVKL